MGKRKPRVKKISPRDIVLAFVASPGNCSSIGTDELVINFEEHVWRQCGDDKETASQLLNHRPKVIVVSRDRQEVRGTMTNVFWFVPHPQYEENLTLLFSTPAA